MGVRYSRWILSKEGADRVRYGTSAVGKQGERWELVGGEVGGGMMSGYREGCGGVGWGEWRAKKANKSSFRVGLHEEWDG